MTLDQFLSEAIKRLLLKLLGIPRALFHPTSTLDIFINEPHNILELQYYYPSFAVGETEAHSTVATCPQ